MKNKLIAVLLALVAIAISFPLGLPLLVLRLVLDLTMTAFVAVAYVLEKAVDGLDVVRRAIYRSTVKPIMEKAEELVK